MRNARAALCVIVGSALLLVLSCGNTVKAAQWPAEIVVPPSQPEALTLAAVELSGSLLRILGRNVPVVHSPVALASHAICITMSSLPARGSEQSTVERRGDNLLLTGSDLRGAIYAVYDYEERDLGVRWLAPGVTYSPSRHPLVPPNVSRTFRPAFSYRDAGVYPVKVSSSWAAHLGLNGMTCPNMDQYGGRSSDFNAISNFYMLIPPAVYSRTHPEFFSLVGGARRFGDHAQLCLSNPDLFRIIVTKLTQWAQSDPSLTVVGLAPNDTEGGECQCEMCRARDILYGGPSGSLLEYVNRAAAAVQARLGARKIKVETLAYLDYEPPPRSTLRASNNVIVCIAPLFADFGRPLTEGASNQSHLASVAGWSRHILAPAELQVWHYGTNFKHYLQPFPDWAAVAPDLTLYKHYGASGVFIQGNRASPGEMSELRAYVLGHLLRDPSTPVWPMLKEWCSLYFGPGGNDVYKYLRLATESGSADARGVRIYDDFNASYLPDSLVSTGLALFDHALKATGQPGFKRYRERIERERICLYQIAIARQVPPAGASLTARKAYKVSADQFWDDLRRMHITEASEGTSVDQAESGLDAYLHLPARREHL